MYVTLNQLVKLCCVTLGEKELGERGYVLCHPYPAVCTGCELGYCGFIGYNTASLGK